MGVIGGGGGWRGEGRGGERRGGASSSRQILVFRGGALQRSTSTQNKVVHCSSYATCCVHCSLLQPMRGISYPLLAK